MGFRTGYPWRTAHMCISSSRVDAANRRQQRLLVAPGDELAHGGQVVARAVAADADDQVRDAGLDERVGVVEVVGLDAPRALDLGLVAAHVLAVLQEDLVLALVG